MADKTTHLTVPEVRRHLEWAASELARLTREGFIEYMQGTVDSQYGPKVESPLEAIFWVWWKALTAANSAESFLWLCPQWEVVVEESVFRLDFAIELQPDENRDRELARAGLKWRPIAVELDGHAFHEKTLEQVTHRNQRDRLLQKAGWVVFHFSWSELTEQPDERVWEVVSAAREQYWALMRDLSAFERSRAEQARTQGRP